MMPMMMNFFAAKRATYRPLKNPSLAAMPPATSAAMPSVESVKRSGVERRESHGRRTVAEQTSLSHT
jgi:hypothetical protein